MNELYLFSIANMVLCFTTAGISFCRLNMMTKPVLYRVRSQYAVNLGCSLVAAFQPLWGEWPKWGSLLIVGALLCGLLASRRAWKNGPPPSVTDHGELLKSDGSKP